MTQQNPASPDGEMVLVPRDAWALWRAECHKPQFLTISSGGGQPCKVTFTYTGEEALKRGQDMHDAITAIALAAQIALASAPRPDAIGEACDRALIASNKVLYELDRPDADAKLAEIRERHGEDANKPWMLSQDLMWLHQAACDRAYLLSAASEALQECERLRVALQRSSECQACLQCRENARRALSLSTPAQGADTLSNPKPEE